LHSQNNDSNQVLRKGTIAQLVEQRTENPCVAGSNPAGTTKASIVRSFYYLNREISSVGLEHYLDKVGVTGSSPVFPTSEGFLVHHFALLCF
jgi:hypothetical protein